MREVIRQMGDVFSSIRSAGGFGILYLAAILFLFRRNREEERFCALFGLLMGILLCNPVTVYLAGRLSPALAGFQPLLAGLPLLLVTACAAPGLFDLAGSGGKRLALLVSLTILIGLAGNGYGLSAERVGGFSLEAVPTEEKLALDLASREDPDGMTLAPDAIIDYARDYAPGLRLLYGKDLWTSGLNLGIMDAYGDELAALHESMQNPEDCMEDIASVAAMYDCDLLIVERFANAREREGQYRLAAQTERYLIYRNGETHEEA